jgi:hypothetical protein
MLDVQFRQSKPPGPPLDSPVERLRASKKAIPPKLVAELVVAARQARASRLLELADRVGQHSPRAASAIRLLVNDFRYAHLVKALDGID